MKINATDEQMRQMAANAVSASRPMGLGFAHFNGSSHFTAEQFDVSAGSIHLDYVEGRMVKFYAWKHDEIWEVREDIDIDYQSWARKFPTWKSLAESVGASVL